MGLPYTVSNNIEQESTAGPCKHPFHTLSASAQHP